MSNILFVSPNPVWGGAATANMAVAKMLRDYGHKVIVNDEYLKDDQYNGLTIDHTPIHQKKFSDRSLLRKLVRDNCIDCIIWSPLVAIYYYPEIKKLKRAGIQQIAIVHSLSLTNDFKGRLMDFLVSLTLACMSHIVYVSQYTLESWNKYIAVRKSKAEKVVIHNIVSGNEPSQRNFLQNIRIGFVGRLSSEKQPRIFCELSKCSSDKFNIYGDGPLFDELKAQYENIEFKGACYDLNQIYRDIDILVMTSKFENCPMVVLEAQSFGIPCVAPNVGGIPEIVENGVNGILYEGYDIETILKAVETVKSNYVTFSKNSLISSKKHSPAQVINCWKKILN